MNDTRSKQKSNSQYFAEQSLEWWRALNGKSDEKDKEQSADRATLARLRRCATPLDAFTVPATSYLLRRLHRPEWKDNDQWLNRVGILAITLACTREHRKSKSGLMAPVGRATLDDEDTARLSEGRFRRLLQVREPDEMLAAFRRLIKFMPEEVDITELAPCILYWNDYTRKDLAFSYYGAYRGYTETTSQS